MTKSLEYQLNLEALERVYRLHLRVTIRQKTIAAIFIGVIFAILGLASSNGDPQRLFIWLPASLTLAALVFWANGSGWFSAKHYAKKAQSENSDILMPFNAKWNDEGIEIRNAKGSYRYGWPDFSKWKADNEFLLVYQGDWIFRVISIPTNEMKLHRMEMITLLKNAGVNGIEFS